MKEPRTLSQNAYSESTLPRPPPSLSLFLLSLLAEPCWECFTCSWAQKRFHIPEHTQGQFARNGRNPKRKEEEEEKGERGGRRAQNAGQISPRSGSRTRKEQNKLRSNWLVIDLRPRDPKKRSISLLEYYSACEQCLHTHTLTHTHTRTALMGRESKQREIVLACR